MLRESTNQTKWRQVALKRAIKAAGALRLGEGKPED